MVDIKEIWTPQIEPFLIKEQGLKFYTRTLLQMIESEYRKAADKLNALGTGYFTVRTWSHGYQSVVKLEFQSLEINNSSVNLSSCKVYENGACEFEWEVAGGLNYHNPNRWVEGNTHFVGQGVIHQLLTGIHNVTQQIEKLRKTLDKKEKNALDELSKLKTKFIAWGLENLKNGETLGCDTLSFRYRGGTYHPDSIAWVVEPSGKRGVLVYKVGNITNEMERTQLSTVVRILDEMFLQMV